MKTVLNKFFAVMLTILITTACESNSNSEKILGTWSYKTEDAIDIDASTRLSDMEEGTAVFKDDGTTNWQSTLTYTFYTKYDTYSVQVVLSHNYTFEGEWNVEEDSYKETGVSVSYSTPNIKSVKAFDSESNEIALSDADKRDISEEYENLVTNVCNEGRKDLLKTHKMSIISLTDNTLIIKDDDGKTHTYNRLQ